MTFLIKFAIITKNVFKFTILNIHTKKELPMLCNAFYLCITTKLIPLLYALIGFGALITIHELGHFLFCKLFDIYTPTFSIGFGPEIFRKKIGHTDFRLAIIPLGGYVEISGLAEVGQGEQQHAYTTDQTSFSDKAYWKKFLVLSGGIIFNLAFAYITFIGLYIVGVHEEHAGVTISALVKDGPAEKSGLKAGDYIVSINETQLRGDNEKLLANAQQLLLSEIQSNPNTEISITVLREEQLKKIDIKTESRTLGDKTIGMIGAAFQDPITRLPFLEAVKKGFAITNQWIFNIAESVKHLIFNRTLEGAGGPLMILTHSFTSAQMGLVPLFIFLAIISINLALMNILPIGALDGGQLLFATIEAIIRRRIPDMLKLGINLASWVLFITLALYLTYKDLLTIFGESIGRIIEQIIVYIK